MVRGWLLAMVFVAGCLDAAPDGSRPDLTPGAAPAVTINGVDLDDVVTRAPDAPAAIDVCALASQLPGDNICSLMCDPDAMKAQLIADGTAQGTCYEMVCVLPGISVTVGVCLPPAP
jgi:hypothetical protein